MPDLHELLAGDVRQWAEFDVAIRQATREARLSRRPSREQLAEAACQGNGYLRQAAVERLARIRKCCRSC